MRKIRVISFDIFQTLVNVNEKIPEIWEGVLGEACTKELAYDCAKEIFKQLPAVMKLAQESEFLTMEEVYVMVAKRAKEAAGWSQDPEWIAFNLMLQHGTAPFYNEVPKVMKELDKQDRYEIVISSDSNHLMVDPILNQIEYSQTFISDDLKCYKGAPKGAFFKRVVHTLHREPEEILHIGDSKAEILGAHAAGLRTCWLNRDHRVWDQEICPNYEIDSLDGLLRILQGN